MAKLWKLKEEIPQEVAGKLSEYPKFLAQLLYNRGLVEKEKIEEFLEPKYAGLNSPFLFMDMKKAVERIWKAIEKNEKITIYGDYDADAVTANAVLQQTFNYVSVQVESYIPDRFTEGYGINTEALEKIRDSGSKVIITVDCGTNSTDAAEFCAQNNIDLIITDHHEVIGELPKAFAVINPKNRTDKYPYEDITGVGVAFKLACGLLSDFEKVTQRLSSRNFLAEDNHKPEKNVRDPEQRQEMDSGHSAVSNFQMRNSGMTQKEYTGGFEKWLLDLVAIGTVADCHSLMGENRILVKFGLRVLAKTKWEGLRALVKTSGLDFSQKPPDVYTLGFVIAPRLNAAGRLEHADTALHLLTEKDPARALERAQELEEINKRRQDQTARIVSEAKEQAILIRERKVIVIAGEGWNKGIVGLVAGRLAEEFYKPVIVMEKTREFSTGSARTAGDFDILAAIKHAAEHTVRFGGHKQAAGLTIETSKLEIFYQKVLDYAEINIPEDNQKVLELEAELASSDLQTTTYNLLTKLEPFGVGNPKPKFLISTMEIASVRQVGAAKQHAQLQLKKDGKAISAIAFNYNPLEKNFKVSDTVDVACELVEDSWNGRNEIKLKIVDLRQSIS